MAEVGHLALQSALVLSSCAIPLDLLGKWRGSTPLIRSGRDATIASCICLTIALAALIVALAGSDFETAYTAWRASAKSSVYERMTPWPGTAGSLLIWICAQTSFVLIAFSKCTEAHRGFNANARVAANFVGVFFLLVLTLRINPFAFFDPVPPGGLAFNLRLRNPTLLMGYASFAVPLAWSFAWLKRDQVMESDPMIRHIRRGILMCWFFLTTGVVFGALLIYLQVGSEGGWLSKVVRDFSLMPWLPATALVCGSRMSKRDAVVAGWIVPLSLITFSSCILTTFLGRPEMPAGARRLFIILLIHIWALAAILAWRRRRRPALGDLEQPGKIQWAEDNS